MTTLQYVHARVIPAAYALLPPEMASPQATALLLAIALQESRCEKRRQMGNGPARSFWQFEEGGGVAGVIAHHKSRQPLGVALVTLQYPVFAPTLHAAMEHNDVLAAVFARLLLWTDPKPLPLRDEPDRGWDVYARTWRPGKPHPQTWRACYAEAWVMATKREITPGDRRLLRSLRIACPTCDGDGCDDCGKPKKRKACCERKDCDCGDTEHAG